MKTDENSLGFSRDVARRTRRGRRAYVMCSPKSGGMELRLESRLEQSIAQALELDPRVRRYRAQPYTVDLTTGELMQQRPAPKPAGAVWYTPDFEAAVGNLTLAVEVKPREFLDAYAADLAEAAAVLRAQGIRLVVFTEGSLPGHGARNLELLTRYQAQAGRWLAEWAEVLGDRSPDQLRGPASRVLENLAPPHHYLIAGLLQGVVQVDLAAHLIERLDFHLEPAHGALQSLEVLDFGC